MMSTGLLEVTYDKEHDIVIQIYNYCLAIHHGGPESLEFSSTSKDLLDFIQDLIHIENRLCRPQYFRMRLLTPTGLVVSDCASIHQFTMEGQDNKKYSVKFSIIALWN